MITKIREMKYATCFNGSRTSVLTQDAVENGEQWFHGRPENEDASIHKHTYMYIV